MADIVVYDTKGNVLEKMYQWDSNQSIKVSGVDTISTSYFHFCNRLSSQTLVVQPTVADQMFTVSVPNILLQEPETIFVFLHQAAGSSGGYRTTYAFQIPVTPKPKPIDYIYTDNAGSVIDGGYTLPIATSTLLGGVMPVTKTTAMTQAVGVDSAGRLYTAPSSSDSSSSSGNPYYGTCSTAAATRAKVVTCSDFSLSTGAIIFVKFTYAQTYAATSSTPVTLNVNGTTAKSVMIYGTTYAPQYSWVAGEVVGFVYDGTNYIMIGGNAVNGNGVSY